MGDDADGNVHVFPPSQEEIFILVNFTPFVSIHKQELNTNNGDPSCHRSMSATGMHFFFITTVMLLAILYSLPLLFYNQ